MNRILSANETRRVEKYAFETVGIPSLVLMESAGRSVYAEILRREKDLTKKKIAIFCGPGNNGGDGFVVARYFLLSGIHPEVILVGNEPKQEDARKNLEIYKKIGGHHTYFSNSGSTVYPSNSIVIDAIFGTGLDRNLEGAYLQAVKAIRQSKAKVYTIDIPSGLHSDTGQILGDAVKADVTIALGFKKRGFFQGEGPDLCGEVVTADISLADEWCEQAGAEPVFEVDAKTAFSLLPIRKKSSHKGSNGHALIFAGSPQKSGAAVLTSRAVLRSGAGLATLATPKSAHVIVKKQLVEVMTEPLPDDGEGFLQPEAFDKLLKLAKGKEVLIVGPGLHPGPALTALLTRLFQKTDLPIVLDADGLNTFGSELSRLGPCLERMVITPHPGEMARLTGLEISQIQSNRIGVAIEYARKTGCTVVLKGAHTIIADRTGTAYINSTGNEGMGTAGVGDVLTGVIGAFIAQGVSLEHAAVAGVYFHGVAGNLAAAKIGIRGMIAGDIIEELPSALRAS